MKKKKKREKVGGGQPGRALVDTKSLSEASDPGPCICSVLIVLRLVSHLPAHFILTTPLRGRLY